MNHCVAHVVHEPSSLTVDQLYEDLFIGCPCHQSTYDLSV